MSGEIKTFSPEFLARTALDKAAIYQRLAQASLNSTDKAHATAYQLLGECVLRLQQECAALRQVANTQQVARDNALGAFRRGVRAMFDCLLVGVANNYHANPVQQQRCAAENALVTTWAQDALSTVSPDDFVEWQAINEAYLRGIEMGRLQARNDMAESAEV